MLTGLRTFFQSVGGSHGDSGTLKNTEMACFEAREAWPVRDSAETLLSTSLNQTRI